MNEVKKKVNCNQFVASASSLHVLHVRPSDRTIASQIPTCPLGAHVNSPLLCVWNRESRPFAYPHFTILFEWEKLGVCCSGSVCMCVCVCDVIILLRWAKRLKTDSLFVSNTSSESLCSWSVSEVKGYCRSATYCHAKQTKNFWNFPSFLWSEASKLHLLHCSIFNALRHPGCSSKEWPNMSHLCLYCICVLLHTPHFSFKNISSRNILLKVTLRFKTKVKNLKTM